MFVKDIDRDDEDCYTNYIKKFKHYDLLNPVTKAQAQSRLDGHSLRDAIIRWIIKKIEQKVKVKDNDYVLNSIKSDNFGIDGLDALLQTQETFDFTRQRSRLIKGNSVHQNRREESKHSNDDFKSYSESFSVHDIQSDS